MYDKLSRRDGVKILFDGGVNFDKIFGYFLSNEKETKLYFKTNLDYHTFKSIAIYSMRFPKIQARIESKMFTNNDFKFYST